MSQATNDYKTDNFTWKLCCNLIKRSCNKAIHYHGVGYVDGCALQLADGIAIV